MDFEFGREGSRDLHQDGKIVQTAVIPLKACDLRESLVQKDFKSTSPG